ncbi:MAG: hypothetical protein U9N77_02060, partial [Thermodesulfobacteriota bacterium]|nr:hypothetical protein [Thermodesulfobacteriota bacterium]
GVGSVFFDKPQSFDLGISFAKTFTTDENFSLTLQYGSTDWGSASDGGDDFEYDKISFGAEYEITKKILFFRKTALRAGYYQSSASGDTNIWEWPDVTGITFGLGLSFGDISDENRDYFQFDLAQELRKLENDDYSDDASLTTVSFSWFF